MSDTIFAPATATGRAGVAVIRVSGEGARDALEELTGRPAPAPRQAQLAVLRDRQRAPLDRGLILFFPAPASFTGEDVVELHLHGGRAVVAGVLDALAAMPGLRMAEPGEFSRRAFLNDKMDLTEAEGIADLVAAETRAQARQALEQMDGALGRLYEAWRERLLQVLARSEAALDFPDEDLPPDVTAGVKAEIEALRAEVAAHLAQAPRGERLREGFRIAVLGPPNAGKSSLVNALAQRDVAIVTDIAGTTRDVLEVHLDLGGYPVILSDTAGLREAAEAIEAEGVRRARRVADRADLRLLMFDARDWPRMDSELMALRQPDDLILLNKGDLVEEPPEGERVISVLNGTGLGPLIEELATLVAARMSDAAGPAPTRPRHRALLAEAEAALARAVSASEDELRAEDLRLATMALGRITGRVDVEAVLDRIFSAFCIGK